MNGHRRGDGQIGQPNSGVTGLGWYKMTMGGPMSWQACCVSRPQEGVLFRSHGVPACVAGCELSEPGVL